MREILIVGAGAMGCLFAARLAEAGAEVTLVDVDQIRLEALARDGITLIDDRGERHVSIRALPAAEVPGPADLVVLFTKAMHSRAAIRSVAHLEDGRACVLTLQNGVGNAEAIAEVFAPERILMGVTDIPADLQSATRVASHGHGTVRIGPYAPKGRGDVNAVVELLRRATFDALVDTDAQAALWEKVAFNAALNAMATITGLSVGGMDKPAGRRIAFAVAGEVVAVATAQGIRLDLTRIEGKIDFALKHHREHKASMLQDRLAGRSTEIEAINGEVVRRAAAVGVPTPVTATLADLVRLCEPDG